MNEVEKPADFEQWTWRKQLLWHHQQIRFHLQATARIAMGMDGPPEENTRSEPVSHIRFTAKVDIKAGEEVVPDPETGMLVPARTPKATIPDLPDQFDWRGEKCPYYCQEKRMHWHQKGLTFFVRAGQHIRIENKCWIVVKDESAVDGFSRMECGVHNLAEKDRRDIDRKVREEFYPGSTGNPTEAKP